MQPFHTVPLVLSTAQLTCPPRCAISALLSGVIA